MNFAVSDYRVKVKESEKKKLPRELKKLWNIVNDALGTVTKGLIQRMDDLELKGRAETIITALWR